MTTEARFVLVCLGAWYGLSVLVLAADLIHEYRKDRRRD